MTPTRAPLLRSLHAQWRQARTRLSRFCAAPDRWRRRRWARDWGAITPTAPVPALARAPQALADQGFSLYDLDERTRTALSADWAALKAARAEGGVAGACRTTGKAFFEEMLADADLVRYPAFLATALDERLLGSVMAAMGMVPHLESVDILASMPTPGALQASQLWHFDVNDDRIIKLFVYLEDCGGRNGPFTFIPAEASQRIAHVVGHYVDDAHIGLHVPRTQWQTVEGAAGTAFLIDTGRCYHFGSRSELPRYAYVATYSSGLKFMKRSTSWSRLLGSRAAELSTLQQAACGLRR